MKENIIKAVCAVLLCALSLTGCKSAVGTPEDNAVKKEESEEETENRFVFGFSGIDMQNPYFVTLESAIREVLQQENCTLISKNPAGDPVLQAEQITEMIEEGMDAIFISPVDWEAITPSLQALEDAGVRIINIDTQVKEMDYVDAYIGSDNKNAGYICGEDLIKRCPDGGKVLILECPTQNSINERITGFEEAIALAEKGFEVVARADTKGEFEQALESTKQLLSQYPDISVIMCGNDQIAVGAKTAVNLLGNDKVVIYGVDGSPDIKKEFKKAETQVAGTAAQSPINIGRTAARTGISILDKEIYEKEVYEEVFMINKDNVDMYGVDGWQ